MKKEKKIDLTNPRYWINPKTRKRYSYFSRDGKGYDDVLAWAKDMEKPNAKRVAETTTRFGYWVSTVWLGMDHQFDRLGAPLIFETMVFKNGESDLDMARYTTEEQALKGHEQMVKNWSNPGYIFWRMIENKTWGIRWSITKYYLKVKRKIFYGR